MMTAAPQRIPDPFFTPATVDTLEQLTKETRRFYIHRLRTDRTVPSELAARVLVNAQVEARARAKKPVGSVGRPRVFPALLAQGVVWRWVDGRAG